MLSSSDRPVLSECMPKSLLGSEVDSQPLTVKTVAV
jgi:hypothetical protein